MLGKNAAGNYSRTLQYLYCPLVLFLNLLDCSANSLWRWGMEYSLSCSKLLGSKLEGLSASIGWFCSIAVLIRIV